MKKIYISSSVILVVIIVGLLGAGQYCYNKSVKRGESIELHKEAETVSAMAEQNNQLLQEARIWFDMQTFETKTLTSTDDLELKAKFLKNEQATGKAVILAHGFRSSSESMGDFVKFYYDQGFDVLMPDARGHGDSEGDYIGFGWHDRKDVQQWISMLVEEENENQIILHGASMGAATVLMTSGESLPPQVKGIVADSGYSSTYDELAYQLKQLYHLPAIPLLQITSAITSVRAGYNFGEASTVEQVSKNTLPLLIIHGDADELVPTEMAHELYDAAGGEKQLWIVPGAGHVKSHTISTEEYQDRVQQFIDKSFEE
ncbi:alpha/beta hydrolase [Radiobacillus sp. PE A8.2]|uniref:alpha/beta hydrolase n=1 Tax=Radiobacillus sp. PE A8.2 TaxID=3380349 RepID=UPI00388D7EEC